jgi:hypothetical protein
MKNHPQITEKWLQEEIAGDTSILQLGDLVVLAKERRQPRAGRLDLLLLDQASNTRYTVELQLGATDESHIIRTIEYWDIERNRYPQINHVAVPVAEDVTSRFLNVISLFNKTIPFVAIQMNAFQVGDNFTLGAVKVLDTVVLGTDEEEETVATNREYWLKERASELTLRMLDEGLKIFNEIEPSAEFRYRKHYIAVNIQKSSSNCIEFQPQKTSMVIRFKVPFSDEISEYIDSSGVKQLSYDKQWSAFRISLVDRELTIYKEQVLHLMGLANEFRKK